MTEYERERRKVVGIVGHEAAKFTVETEAKARALIRRLLEGADAMTSGGCHLGGIDIYAEEEAKDMGLDLIVHKPKRRIWEGGYKQRNILIAESCTEMHNIVVAEYPRGYTGMRFNFCYHCGTDDHVKSGGCWTRKYAQKLGKPSFHHTIRREP